MTWEAYTKTLMALCLWREARSEGTAGMAAVGHVIWNRHKLIGKSVIGVITADAQFTSINPYKKNYDSQLDIWPVPPDQKFEVAMGLADLILSDTSVDPTGGATHYRNPRTATSKSFQRGIDEGSLIKTVSIGQHDFYREVII